MARMHKAIRSAAFLFILLALICALAFAMENKTAYTRDGIHFISKERMEENIKYQFAKAGDYREIQVPSDTLVVGASFNSQWAIEEEPDEDETQQDEENAGEVKASEEKTGEDKANELDARAGEDASQPAEESSGIKYPYAALGIGLLLIIGLVVWTPRKRGRRRRRGRRSLRRR